jgi:uncharacterized membrane protein
VNEDRLASLEARIDELERRIGSMPASPARPVAPGALWASVEGQSPSGAGAPVLSVSRTPRSSEQLSTRLLAWAGGLALIIGAILFLSLAFTRGWIGPEASVLIGLVGGSAAVAGGGYLFDRSKGTPALALIGVGVGTSSLALSAGTQAYHLFPAEIGLVGFALLAAATTVIAVRSNSQTVAALGLVAVGAAPPLVGAPATLLALFFAGATLLATTILGLRRTWPWPPALVLLVTIPQLAAWLSADQPVALALAAIAGFWTLSAVASRSGANGGPLLPRSPHHAIHAATAIMLVVGAWVTFEAIRYILRDSDAPRILLLAALVAAYAVIAAERLIRRGGEDPYGLLVGGVGMVVLAVAIATEATGPWQPIGNLALGALGAATFAVGVVRRRRVARRFGLGLLSLVTVKVFVVDLGSVDVAYRVLSFLGMGLVLLGSAFLAGRFREPPVIESVEEVGPGAPT